MLTAVSRCSTVNLALSLHRPEKYGAYISVDRFRVCTKQSYESSQVNSSVTAMICTADIMCIVMQQHGANHDHVLEHSLHQLLREVHHRNGYQPLPHPATAVLGVSKRRRLAGPLGYTREKLHEPTRLSYFLHGQGIYICCWPTLRFSVVFSNIPYFSTFVQHTSQMH